MSINSFLEKLKQRVSPTPVDETGMWYQDKDVVVPSNKITMKGPEGEDDYFDEPIVGTGMQSGKSVVMQPGEDYEFPDDDSVYESKQMQLGALTYTPYSRSQNQYTDSPSPRPVIKPRVGDTVDPNYEKLYTNLVLDAGSLLPKPYGGIVFDVASKLSAAEDDDYNQGLEFVSGKKANSLSVLNDIYKISQAKPYKYQGKKQLGGNIDNISPEGDVNFSLGNKNKLAFTVRGSGNIPNFKLNSVSPNLSYNNKGFSADVSPNSFGAGYNNSKVNLNANATMRNNAVESAGIQGSYNVTPNLSLTGNYNINKGEQGTDKNYFAGFRYSKSFQNGGMSIPGVNGTVIASDNSPRLKKAYMQKAGYVKYVPPSQRPLAGFSSSTPSTTDNTRLVTQNTNVSAANRKAAEAAEYARKVGTITQGKVKSNYEKAKEASSLVAQAQQRKGSADPLDYVLDMVNPASLAFAATDLVGNTGSAVSNAAQGNFAEAGTDLLGAGLNALSVLPAAAELRGPLKSAGKYLTTQTPLKNTYKYNPLAFKPNPEAYYRGIGRTGLDDALESGVLRPGNKTGISYGEDVYTTKNFNQAKGNYSKDQPYGVGDPWGDDWKMVKPKDSRSYIVEIPESSFTNKIRATNSIDPENIFLNRGHIPIDDVKLLKQDWLKGYKQIKKPEFKDGGETDHDDDKDMVNGVASILRRVKDKDNRQDLANQLSKQFDREKVRYNLSDFLNKSKVKK